eukprot:Lithocolla_globosa_v1_NODE_9141_length_740_cov_1.214599.p2 type:complete len:143 gc:universal NODE_9141_length_740_cov_1.214599:173-601(+)
MLFPTLRVSGSNQPTSRLLVTLWPPSLVVPNLTNGTNYKNWLALKDYLHNRHVSRPPNLELSCIGTLRFPGPVKVFTVSKMVPIILLLVVSLLLLIVIYYGWKLPSQAENKLNNSLRVFSLSILGPNSLTILALLLTGTQQV